MLGAWPWVVLAAFSSGMRGLGADLLNMMARFRLVWSLEIGITIVLLAITLDRLSKVWAQRLPRGSSGGTPVWAAGMPALPLIGPWPLSPPSWLVAQLVPYLQEVGYPAEPCFAGAASSMPRSRNSWRSMSVQGGDGQHSQIRQLSAC